MAQFRTAGVWSHWPLADALRWRMQRGCTVDHAMTELRVLMRRDPENLFATGVLIGSNPLRPRGWDFPPYEPFGAPNRLPQNTPNLGRVPGEDWGDLKAVVDSRQQPTSRLDYISTWSEAWDFVEFDKTRLMIAWMRLIEKSADELPNDENRSDDQSRKPGRPPVLPGIKEAMLKKFRSKIDELFDPKIWSGSKLAKAFKTSRSTAERARKAIEDDIREGVLSSDLNQK
jgi:hypothetical protein